MSEQIKAEWLIFMQEEKDGFQQKRTVFNEKRRFQRNEQRRQVGNNCFQG